MRLGKDHSLLWQVWSARLRADRTGILLVISPFLGADSLGVDGGGAELDIPYELTLHKRDPVTILSHPELKALHPTGAAPVIQDDRLLLAEAAAIVEYIIVKHEDGRLRLMPDHPIQLAVQERRPAYRRAMAKGDPDLEPLLT